MEEVALLNWINSFPHLTKTPTSLADLADGIVLFEVGRHDDPPNRIRSCLSAEGPFERRHTGRMMTFSLVGCQSDRADPF
jgi:hypothetical protein